MQSRNFRLQRVGDINWLEKYYQFQKISFSIDELIILNASRDIRSLNNFVKVVSRLTNHVFIPTAAGGGVRTMEDAELLFINGADKIVLNTILITNPNLVKQLVDKYGSQSMIASVDYKNNNGINEVFISDGTTKIDLNLTEYIKYLLNLNIGEIYLNSIDKDGTGFGFDFETINSIKTNITVPLIIAGGAGNEYHLLEGLKTDQVNAVATANLFNFLGDSLPKARKNIIKHNINIARWDSVENENMQTIFG